MKLTAQYWTYGPHFGAMPLCASTLHIFSACHHTASFPREMRPWNAPQVSSFRNCPCRSCRLTMALRRARSVEPEQATKLKHRPSTFRCELVPETSRAMINRVQSYHKVSRRMCAFARNSFLILRQGKRPRLVRDSPNGRAGRYVHGCYMCVTMRLPSPSGSTDVLGGGENPRPFLSGRSTVCLRNW